MTPSRNEDDKLLAKPCPECGKIGGGFDLMYVAGGYGVFVAECPEHGDYHFDGFNNARFPKVEGNLNREALNTERMLDEYRNNLRKGRRAKKPE